MKMKNGIMFLLISISIGYLIYSYLYLDYSSGWMMHHHYAYYNDYSRMMYYANSSLNVVAYSVIIISIIVLISDKNKSKNNALSILNNRLTIGEISIEEYKSIKEVLNTK